MPFFSRKDQIPFLLHKKIQRLQSLEIVLKPPEAPKASWINLQERGGYSSPRTWASPKEIFEAFRLHKTLFFSIVQEIQRLQSL